MKRSYYLLPMLAAVSLMSGCKSTSHVAVANNGVVKTETVNQTESVIHNVLYGSWNVTDVAGRAVTGTDRPYIEFGEDPTNPFLVKCYAYDGCNYLNGEYAVTPGGEMKRTSDLISTMRMCGGADYEMGVNLALNNVTGYTMEKAGLGYTLQLTGQSGQILMTLRKLETEFVNGAWDVTSIRGASVDPELGIKIVIDLNEHSIHGNAGCNTMNGKVSVNPNVSNSISFSDIVTTRMTCPAIATEQALINALSSVATVVPGTTTDTAVLRMADGTEAVALKRANI